MVNKLNQIAKEWVFPPSLYRFGARTHKVFKHRYMRRLVETNKAFQNRHKGERCFILATGPSIRTQNLECLEGEICIGVSQFYLHEKIDTIRPRYHVLAPSHPPFDFDLYHQYFEGLDKYYRNVDVEYFLGYRPYDFSVLSFLEAFPQYNWDTLNFVDYSSHTRLTERNYLNPKIWDISDSQAFSPRTVIYTAIQVASYMGFSEMYLLGCDHDYLKDVTRVQNHHFYKESNDSINQKEILGGFSLERWFEEYYYRWKQYRLMNTYLDSINCSIADATLDGMLDMFPKVSLECLFITT